MSIKNKKSEWYLVKIISGGRITLPNTVRKYYELKNGEVIMIRVAKIPDRQGEPEI